MNRIDLKILKSNIESANSAAELSALIEPLSDAIEALSHEAEPKPNAPELADCEDLARVFHDRVMLLCPVLSPTWIFSKGKLGMQRLWQRKLDQETEELLSFDCHSEVLFARGCFHMMRGEADKARARLKEAGMHGLIDNGGKDVAAMCAAALARL